MNTKTVIQFVGTALALSLSACVDNATDADGDGFDVYQDCDDSDAAINPGADELCDGIDNDCSGMIDDYPVDGYTAYVDADADGHGSTTATYFCSYPPYGYVDNQDDCDDGLESVYPGAPEYCDGLDNNCDGIADNDPINPITWYADVDLDGFGDPETSFESCEPPSGYTDDNTDCDDADADINPDTSWYPDDDLDGFGDSSDGAGINSCEPPKDHIRNGEDCNDSNSEVNPDSEEICDGEDSNCDGLIEDNDWDDDGDGLSECEGDCDDTDASIFPGAVELCDNVDNNCSSRSDEGCYYQTEADSDIKLYGVNTESEHFGYSVASGGDLNGDGVDDLVVGAPRSTPYLTQDEVGRADVYFGPLSSAIMSPMDADISIDGLEAYDSLGMNVKISSDLNGDGYDDLLVEANGVDVGQHINNGAVYLFLGPLTASPEITEADAIIRGSGSFSKFGEDAMQTFDLDNDGADELIGSIFGRDTRAGALAIFSEPEGTLSVDDDSDVLITGSMQYAYAGRSMTAGDYNSDGILDIVYGEEGTNQGFIVYGPITGDLDGSDSDVELSSTKGIDRLPGGTISNLAAGDFDGDGYDDLVIGSMHSSYGATYGGRVATFSGPLTSTVNVESDQDFFTYETVNYHYMGSYLDTILAEDIDGDGRSDLIVGVGDNDDAHISAGAAFMHYGPLSGTRSHTQFDHATFGHTNYTRFGRSLGLGDLNDDGQLDLVGGTHLFGIDGSGGTYVFFY
jgi:hypothetical protein